MVAAGTILLDDGFSDDNGSVGLDSEAVLRFLQIRIQSLAVLWCEGVASCSVITIRVSLKVLEKTFVMVLLCHSSKYGCF